MDGKILTFTVNIVARCKSLEEAQSVCFDLRSVGVDAAIREENLASWKIPRVPRSAVGVQVTVSPEDTADAAKYIAEHYSYLASVKEELLCPECLTAGRTPEPYTLGFVKTIWLAFHVRLLGRIFCPSCHSTWKADSKANT